MGFDYFPRVNCEIQAPRSDFEFIQRAKIQVHAGGAVEIINEKPEAEREAALQDKIRLSYPIQTLLGSRTELTLAELIETWERIARKSMPLCEKCPLNADGTPLGCWGCFNYPISQAGEEWLMDRFQPPRDSYLAARIKDSGVTGERLDKARIEPDPKRDGAKFSVFMPPGPVEKSVEGERITSSMILEYLIDCRPSLDSPTMLGLLWDFNATDMESSDYLVLLTHFMLGRQFGASSPINMVFDKVNFTMDLAPSHDRFIIQFKFFLKACYTALKNECRLAVDG